MKTSTRNSLAARPPAFTYDREDVLRCDRVPLPRLAERFGTPLYIYSGSTIRDRFRTFDKGFRGVPHTVCYSVKANSNVAILKLLAKLGCGFDIVSGGELERVLRADRRAARRVVFSGVGKTEAEIDLALRSDILLFNVESEGELATLAARAARLKKTARLALRVNPDVSAETHPYIATGLHHHKFGVPIGEALALYRGAAAEKYLDPAGVSAHIGSQITDVAPFCTAISHLAELVKALRAAGFRIRYVDAGGGLGIPYHPHSGQYLASAKDFAAHAAAYAKAVAQPLRGLDLHLLLEPGRAIVGPAGALLARVLYIKNNNGKHFVIVDAAMNDLIRPSLYGAHHEVIAVTPRTDHRQNQNTQYDVVGPICETGDFFARDRVLPTMQQGDLLAILDTGAYGMSLSSNYNSRPRPAEVLVDGRSMRQIRRREKIDDLLRNER